MRRVIVANFPKAGASVPLPEGEAHHLIKVLRQSDGASIELLNGLGSSCLATLRLKGKRAFAEYAQEGRQADPNEPHPLHLFVAMPKMEALSWITEKCVELNVASLTLFKGDQSVVHAKSKAMGKGKGKKAVQKAHQIERLKKQALEAMKQSGRLTFLQIGEPLADLAAVLASPRFTRCHHRWVADESLALMSQRQHLLAVRAQDILPRQQVAVLIGPEGGWSVEERYALGELKRLSLGSQVLRVETATVMLAAVLTAQMQSL